MSQRIIPGLSRWDVSFVTMWSIIVEGLSVTRVGKVIIGSEPQLTKSLIHVSVDLVFSFVDMSILKLDETMFCVH